MQIKGLSKSLYKIYPYACTQTIRSLQIEQRKKFLGDWEILKARKVPDKKISNCQPPILILSKG